MMSIMIFVRLHWPAPLLWFVKLYASALSPLLVLIGVLTTLAGLATGSVSISVIGMYDVLVFSILIYRVTRPPDASGNFENAFGSHWEKLLSGNKKNHFLPRRNSLWLPAVPRPRFEQNISF